MLGKELKAQISAIPDEAVVEIAIPTDDEIVWYGIEGVEQSDDDEHRLIYVVEEPTMM